MSQPKVSLRPPQRHPQDRRDSLRYWLPLPLSVTARWNGRAVLLERVRALRNISSGGLYFSLARAATNSIPEDAELEISFPLHEPTFGASRLYARCRARVVRRDAPHGVAAAFEEVQFVREERPTRLPVPISA